MRTWTKFLLVLLALLIPLSAATAQDLDGVWFKVKYVAQGYEFGPALEKPHKAAFKTQFYMYFELSSVESDHVVYNYHVWAETAPHHWEMVETQSMSLYGQPESFCVDHWTTVYGPGSEEVGSYGVERFVIKKDKAGKTKKANFTTLAREVISATLDGVNDFVGSAKVKGKSVPEKKLPFDP